MLAPDFRPCEFASTKTLLCGGAHGAGMKKASPLPCLRIQLPLSSVRCLVSQRRVHDAQGPAEAERRVREASGALAAKGRNPPSLAFKSIFHSTPTTGGGSPNEKCSQNSTWPINATFATHLGRRRGPKSENFPRAY